MYRPLDVNVVGYMGQAPQSMNEIMMKDNIYEALERFCVYYQLMESNSEGDYQMKQCH